MFYFRVVEVPVRQVLTQLTQRANPVATEMPQDPRQKLVWLPTATSEGGSGVILITTRTDAEKIGADLPPEFIAD